MRILGLDYGNHTIGVAVSDESLTIALGLEVIRRDDDASIKKSVERLKEIIREYTVGTLVLGYPKNLDNTVSLRCVKTEEFKERLHRNFKHLEIILWDERYSTKAVSRVLKEEHMAHAKQNEVIDKMAAVYILQGYLDSLHHKEDKMSENRFEDFNLEDLKKLDGLEDLDLEDLKKLDGLEDLNLEDLKDLDLDDLEDFDDTDLRIISVVDEETGEEIELFVLDIIDYKDSAYYLLIEIDAYEDDEAEATILKEAKDENGYLVYKTVTDDKEFDAVAKLFKENTFGEYDLE